MRILVVDEDRKHMPQVCDVLRALGHDVLHIPDWRQIQVELRAFKPEGIVLDLMIPASGLPLNECGHGYTTGEYIYKTLIAPIAPDVPFVVLSAADQSVSFVEAATERLRKLSPCRAILEKPCDERSIVVHLESQEEC